MAERDPWDIPTPTQGAPTQALSDEEYARYLAYSERFRSYGTSSAGPSNLPSPLPSNPPSYLPSPYHHAVVATPPRPQVTPSLSRQTSRRSERSAGGGGGGGCCGGGATDASSPQRERPSPLGSPGYRRSGTSTPARGASRRLSTDPTRTPTGQSYTCNALGDIVENKEGKEVYQKMHEYLFTVFRRDVLLKWDQIPDDRKNYLIELLQSEYPQPAHLQFDASRMLKKAAKTMRSRRSELYDRARDGRGKPAWCDEDLWEQLCIKLHEDPDMGRQQRQAREAQRTPSHLGSGGWAAMKRDFKATYGRNPTTKEKEYALNKGFSVLMEKMGAKMANASDADQDVAPPSPLRDSEISDLE